MTTIITGAGSGIGKRLAELILARGENVVALDIAFTDSARVDLESSGGKVHFETVDVRDGAAVIGAVEAGIAALGKPRLAINCAGVLVAEPFDQISEDDFRRVVDINLYGSRNFAAATLPHLKHGGHLVLTASLAGFVASYGYAAYSSSKFAVIGLAEVLRLEQKPNGVSVSVVAPPEVVTPMVVEERRSGSQITGKMKQFAGSMELDPAARAILEGIDDGGFMIVPSLQAKLTIALGRFAPRAVSHFVADRLLKRFSS